ncbi:MAG TPA: efflux RND transporter periplasmic adaptor subunit [Reyranella sp.]|jgi:RND family efflux transporter MFP subunit
MTRRLLFPLLAVVGVAFAVAAIVLGERTPPGASAAVHPTMSPFATAVAGAGIVEASSENIAIGAAVPGIVTKIAVKWGDRVQSGDVLFTIDDRDVQGQLLIAGAKVREADATLAKARNLLEVGEGLTRGSSISAVDLANRRYDVGIDEALLASANAQVDHLKIEAERRVVRAPLAGRILQIKVHPGEYAPGGVATPPLMLLGDDTRLHVRVDINENDAWRVKPTAAAVAFVPGNPAMKAPLRFERIEPYAVPKASLTGESTERTDTRVLQVIYSFERGTLPIYVGQRMDVYVEAPAASVASR